MSPAREEILTRIRGALRDVPRDEAATDVAVARDYRRTDDRSRAELLELLADRLRDYGAEVQRVDDVAQAVAATCREHEVTRLAVAPGVPPRWRPSRTSELIEDHGLTALELDEIDGALTGCAVAIAETGTLVLDGGERSGRRVLTLVPDRHICVVEAHQIVGQVPEGIAAVQPAIREHNAPVTLISGGSATSDIELSRVEGVHGPRHLTVLIVG